MSSVPALTDEAARDRVRREHDLSFVVSAGAGTGKTTLLVDRIVGIVLRGHLRLDQIAAVTFTENAASTLKLRIRDGLEKARMQATDAAQVAFASRGLDAIERAQISTIHALCAAILQERPVECGVVPGFRVADESTADLIFEEAWEEWLQDLLTSENALLETALSAGISVERPTPFGESASLRKLARRLIEHRDLKPHVIESAVDGAGARAWAKEKISEALTRAEGKPEADPLVAAIRLRSAEISTLDGVEGPELLEALARLAITKPGGNKRNWKSDTDFDICRAIMTDLSEASEEWRKNRSAALYSGLVHALSPVVAIYERRKNELGVLDYVDLLIKCRNAFRDKAPVRAYFREKWHTIIVDEYQDTDPLQVEIVEYLSGLRPEEPGTEALRPLVIVGDPKQSIYRFRRADASVFASACEAAKTRPGTALVTLDQNFRSAPAILRFSNSVFGTTIRKSVHGQPDYEPLQPRRDLDDGAALLSLAFHADEGDLLAAEATALAGFAATVQRGALEVRSESDSRGAVKRKSCAADLMILARRLTNVKVLESALERAGVAYVVDGGRSFFDRAEVVETHAVLRAIDDPTDRLSLVASLRSMYFGVSDADIAEWNFGGRSLQLPSAPLEEGDQQHSVGRALVLLRRFHELRTSLSVPALLERLFDETSVFAALHAAAAGSFDRARPRIANLRKIVQLARSSRSLGLLTLRGFNRFLSTRFEGGGEEPDLPVARPGDSNTVRILTIHRAKGLESPIVAVFDCLDQIRAGRPDVVPIRETGKIALGFVKDCQPPQWDTLVEREQARLEEENHRLRYVACTRARDWLVVPTPPAQEQVGEFWRDVVRGIRAAPEKDKVTLEVKGFELPELPVDAGPSGLVPDASRSLSVDGWRATRAQLLEKASALAPIPISVREDSLQEAPPRMTPLAPVGRDFGAFVHRLLELATFDRPESVREISRQLAPSFPLSGDMVVRAEAQAEAALSLPIMREAARAKAIYRETPVSYVQENRLIEGVCDLAFEDESGWVVVDYKTEAIAEAELQAQAAHHAGQLRRYARGLALASQSNVSRRFVVFTSLGRQVAV